MHLGDAIARPCAQARRTVELTIRVGALAAALGVDSRFVPAAQADVDLLHAYRLLVHAEIENFIENLASTVVDTTENLFRNGTLTHAGHHLYVGWSISRQSKKPFKARYPMFDAAEATAALGSDYSRLAPALEQHRGRIATNNGIKEANVRTLMMPIGCRENFYAPGLLSQLTDFGTDRGAAAHSSGIVAAAQWPTGSSEIVRARTVIKGLDLLERYIARLLTPVSI
ncbi:MAG: hypothetical protein ACRBK7_20835 [Acidimicrobiales bacterium]